MGRKRKYRYYMADFETTVYEGQTSTEVWAGAIVEFYTEKVEILHSIEDMFLYIRKLSANVVVYFHNLKFDGGFWLDYIINKLHMKEAIEVIGDEEKDFKWSEPYEMPNNTFLYSISNRGQWYRIIIKVNNKYIEIRDSLKLLPFSVKKIGKDFKCKHQKLDMEYKGYRYAGCTITDEEAKYIANDVLVPKEALEIMFNEGHNKITIGSCCMAEFKKVYKKEYYENMFPDLTEISLSEQYTQENADLYIRKSYKGGWCYLVKGKENKIFHDGTTADVNSLYPSMMHSESGNYFPVGHPTFWEGNFIPQCAKINNRYYFVRIKTRFYIKEGMLPFIQIKGSPLYRGTESLESSDYVNPKTGESSPYYIDKNGQWHDTRVVLTLTMTDYILLKEHYNLVDFEILNGCYFDTRIGIFDEYINKYREIKMREKGAKRQIAKLFLNNLYGKFASNTDSSFKFAVPNDENSLSFEYVEEYNKKAGYIPVGSAITSYARNFTIRAAQQNYYGSDKRGFIYADTDSIHCDLMPSEIRGIKVDDNAFCCWKLEASWDDAIFVRQKTYIEHVTHEDLVQVEKPWYNIKCAGMPDRCKEIFRRSLEHELAWDDEDMCDLNRNLINKKCTLSDFKRGLKIYGKLIPKRIAGGIVLEETTYEVR
jgi:hypothetical protein